MIVTRSRLFAIASLAMWTGWVSAAGNTREDLRNQLQRAAWVTVRTVTAIPTDVIQVLRSHFRPDDRLADRNESFDATDALTGRPQRRLVLAGEAGMHWFIVYEHGGRGHHLDLAMIDRTGGKPRVVLIGQLGAGRHDDVAGWHLELAELREAVKNGGLSMGDPDEGHY